MEYLAAQISIDALKYANSPVGLFVCLKTS